MTTRLTPERLRHRFSQRGDTETVPTAELRAVLDHLKNEILDAAAVSAQLFDHDLREEHTTRLDQQGRSIIRGMLDISALHDDAQRMRLRIAELEEYRRYENRSIRERFRDWIAQIRTMFALWNVRHTHARKNMDHDFREPIDLRYTTVGEEEAARIEAEMTHDEQISLLEAIGAVEKKPQPCPAQIGGVMCVYDATYICIHCGFPPFDDQENHAHPHARP